MPLFSDLPGDKGFFILWPASPALVSLKLKPIPSSSAGLRIEDQYEEDYLFNGGQLLRGVGHGCPVLFPERIGPERVA